MTRNEGSIDRALRITVGAVLLALAATGSIGAWGFVGVVPLLTGALGWCPLYTLFGFSTYPRARR